MNLYEARVRGGRVRIEELVVVSDQRRAIWFVPMYFYEEGRSFNNYKKDHQVPLRRVSLPLSGLVQATPEGALRALHADARRESTRAFRALVTAQDNLDIIEAVLDATDDGEE